MALDYCAPHGIPLSIFMGRIQGFGEPLWTDDDRQAAIWWQERENSLCPRCRYPRNECMGVDGPNYQAELIRCFACEARDAKNAELARDEASSSHGMYIMVNEVSEPQDAP